MFDHCIYDRFEQCFHDCRRCPQREIPEPDIDHIRDIELDTELAVQLIPLIL